MNRHGARGIVGPHEPGREHTTMTNQLPLIPFGQRSNFEIPRVNIGAMRLPDNDDEAVALIRHAIDSGMRYIDTSRCYGESEVKLGKALKDGYREKVILSTKWAPWIKKIHEDDDASEDCVLRRIEESMRRLDVDYLDYYQIWNILDRTCYNAAVRKGGFLDGIRKAMDRGLVGHTGFTSHDTVENLLGYLDEVDWCEIILLTYNMLNKTYEPVLEKAHRRGIGTIVMNPVAGGKLAENSPVFEPLVRETGSRSLADLGIRWVLSNPCVDTIISGIAKVSDCNDSIASAAGETLSDSQRRKVDAFVDRLAPRHFTLCTNCGYCMPCPRGVNIPRVMDAVYNHRVLGFAKSARDGYRAIGSDKWNPGKKADACTSCGVCLDKCTQGIDIPAEMNFARETFR